MEKKTIPQIIQDDPWLTSHEKDITARIKRFNNMLAGLRERYGSIEEMAQGHEYFGINYDAEAKGWYYREWAPAAKALHLMGDFNGWNKTSHPLKQDNEGVWEIFLEDASYQDRFVHGSKFKVVVTDCEGNVVDRIPAYIRRVVQDEKTHEFAAQVWSPKEQFSWKGDDFDISTLKTPYIYECHVGMAQEKDGVGTYQEFAEEILPRIKALGYNAIQMMAIQEHPYYGSFGYHVSNFFAASSRSGTPEDLKALIKKAHSMGIAVILDIVHSHSVKNIHEGLNLFDGTGHQYFHAGGKGEHPDWDSKLFNYGKWEVMQFLLSNIRYWLEEFHFDGFRFDGVSSMLYEHHGHVSFDNYDKYFKDGVDNDAIVYLQLANFLAHRIKPGAISIAEDVSGMPGLCRNIEDGGIGFDYRLAMGMPDYWTKILSKQRDEDWNMHEMWGSLSNRRYKEKTIAYAESHDQGLVGDKTIAFWLMDKDMYTGMMVSDENLVIERGLALHKMIRLISLALGGEGYLNFIGNEFGHPEWIDFPREGNNWSYHYARRQWSLVDNPDLKYQYFNAFDKEMLALAQEYDIPAQEFAKSLNIDDQNKILVFSRGDLVFIFNFHPNNAIPDYKFYVAEEGAYQVILNSDDKEFGGHGRINKEVTYKTDKKQFLQLYITNRTALVLQKIDS